MRKTQKKKTNTKKLPQTLIQNHEYFTMRTNLIIWKTQMKLQIAAAKIIVNKEQKKKKNNSNVSNSQMYKIILKIMIAQQNLTKKFLGRSKRQLRISQIKILLNKNNKCLHKHQKLNQLFRVNKLSSVLKLTLKAFISLRGRIIKENSRNYINSNNNSSNISNNNFSKNNNSNNNNNNKKNNSNNKQIPLIYHLHKTQVIKKVKSNVVFERKINLLLKNALKLQIYIKNEINLSLQIF